MRKVLADELFINCVAVFIGVFLSLSGLGELDPALIEKWPGRPLTPESDCHLVGTGLGASFTHLIREASLAGGAGGIIIRTIVRRCRDHTRSLAEVVDVGRGCPPPLETRCIYSRDPFPLG